MPSDSTDWPPASGAATHAHNPAPRLFRKDIFGPRRTILGRRRGLGRCRCRRAVSALGPSSQPFCSESSRRAYRLRIIGIRGSFLRNCALFRFLDLRVPSMYGLAARWSCVARRNGSRIRWIGRGIGGSGRRVRLGWGLRCPAGLVCIVPVARSQSRAPLPRMEMRRSRPNPGATADGFDPTINRAVSEADHFSSAGIPGQQRKLAATRIKTILPLRRRDVRARYRAGNQDCSNWETNADQGSSSRAHAKARSFNPRNEGPLMEGESLETRADTGFSVATGRAAVVAGGFAGVVTRWAAAAGAGSMEAPHIPQ